MIQSIMALFFFPCLGVGAYAIINRLSKERLHTLWIQRPSLINAMGHR